MTLELAYKPEPINKKEARKNLQEVNFLAIPKELPHLQGISDDERLTHVTSWGTLFRNNC